MSSTQLANINETSYYLNATTSSQNQLFSFTPHRVLIENLGTGVLFVRAANESDSTGTITVPTVGATGSWTSIGPGKSYSLNWSSTFAFKRLLYIASIAGDFTIKLTRGE
jgi:hypothetical protein